MFAIKTKWNSLIKDISLNKRNYIFRLIALILGVYIFSVAIAVSAQTAVGVSMIDVTVFASIFYSHGLMDTTIISNDWITPGTIDVANTPYALYVGILYVGMSIVSIIFMAVWVTRDYKKTGNKMLFVYMVLGVIGDIVIIFTIPLLIDLNLTYIDADAIAHAKGPIRAYIFMVAFVLYALGIAFWVYSGLLAGPYNSICTNFLKMTKIESYSFGRTAMNVTILIPGLIIILLCGMVGTRSWTEVADFIMVNISFGTLFFVFILGAFVTACKKLISKVLIMKPHVDVDQPIQSELNLDDLNEEKVVNE